MADRWDCVSGTMIPDDSGPYVPYHDYLSTACDRDALQARVVHLEAENVRLREELATLDATLRQVEDQARDSYYAAIRDTDEET